MTLEFALDFVSRSFAMDTGGWLVLLAFAGCGYTLLSLMLGDHGPAILGTPILIGGTAMGHRALVDMGIQLHGDKLMNMTIGMAASMMVSGMLVIAILWSWNASMSR